MNPLSVVATETTSLAAEARALADEIEALNRQTTRAAEALASDQPLSEFFMSELRSAS